MAQVGTPKYILGERIAQGGMAEIFLGKIVGAEGFTRICAFKRVLPHYTEDAEFLQMFRNEAMLAKQLQNKNIVQVYDFDGDGANGPMLVMEYIDGQDLKSVLREAERAKRRIPIELAVYMAAEMLNGLAYAHACVDITGKSLGIIHRDISPQNVLVSYDGDVKITDFGIAKVQNTANMTRAGVLKGKFRYMSPEQAFGQPIDARSDIFAVGIVLYEMITMTRLFKGDDDLQVLQAVRDCKIRSPNEIRGTEVPAELETIMVRLLQKDLKQRYQTAREAAKDLTRFLYSHRKDFFPGELADFMQRLFASKVEAARERMRTTLALPVETIQRGGQAGFDGSGPSSEGAKGSSAMPWEQPSAPSAPSSRGFQGASGYSVPPSGVSSSNRISLVTNPGRRDGGDLGSVDRGVKIDMLRTTNQAEQLRVRNSRRMAGGLRVDEAVHRSDTQIRRLSKGSGLGIERIVVALIVALLVAGGAFAFALKKRIVRFPTEIDLKPAMESQRRVKVVINGVPYDKGDWVVLPLRLSLAPGTYDIRVTKPGFQDKLIHLEASLLGTFIEGVRSETVILGKDKELASVKIITIPDKAKIEIDGGLFSGESGRFIDLVPVGRHRVVITHPQCAPQAVEIDIPLSAVREAVVKAYTLQQCRNRD
jgi:serine/threonine protein kinase